MFNKIFDTAVVHPTAAGLMVEYVTVSSVNWACTESADRYIPLHSGTADIIRAQQNEGKEVVIQADWENDSKEVLPTHLSFNPITDLAGYKRRAQSYVKRFIHPQMASVNASVIYGFNVINNKFLEAGVVFSEKDRSLKYIEVMEKADELEEANPPEPEMAEELMGLLERYIEYRETLDRSYFAWDISEETIKAIDSVQLDAELLTTGVGTGDKEINLETQKIIIDQENPASEDEVNLSFLEVAYNKMTETNSLECEINVNNEIISYIRVPGKAIVTSCIVGGTSMVSEDEELFYANYLKNTTLVDKINYLNSRTIVDAKKQVDKITKDYTTRLDTLNNLK